MNLNKRYKIAYLTSTDPLDKLNWSGTHYFMVKALQDHCGDVVVLGPVRVYFLYFLRILNRLLLLAIGKKYNSAHNKLLAGYYGKIFLKKISTANIDFIFAPVSSAEISQLPTNIPIVYASDATFKVLKDYYPNFKSILNYSSREIISTEKAALENAAVVLYPTNWAADSCKQEYDIPEDKIYVVPYGANLERIPKSEEAIQKKYDGKCHLLLLGVSWERKGGPIAFDALMHLRAMGIDAHLTVCGCTPPKAFRNAYVRVIPFLDKSETNDEELLRSLLLEAHFLIFPTRAECFGIVCCEASAFGVPVIACDTGGVAGAVQPGVNGYLLQYSSTGKDYAEVISNVFQDKAAYSRLSQSSRKHYEEQLNWDKWGSEVKKILDEKIHA